MEETIIKPSEQNTVSGLSEPTEKKEFSYGHAKGILMEMARQRSSANESRILESEFDLDGTHFTFKLPNTILKDIFYEIKQDFIDQLRKKLSNYSITAEAEVTAVETKAKPRTEQEKFENMAQKNPDLWKLKESLDLDLMF